MDTIFSNGKIYEQIATRHDPIYNQILRAIDIIKKFIVNRGLIVYGGTAIDYALRAHGDKIYPDDLLLVPDLDFYSPDNVNDAYDLATQLYAAGYSEARVINAKHTGTMKVDIGDNHFLADISYLPRELYEVIPTLEFERMRIVHPNFQALDQHHDLSSPFSSAPTEEIFNRWSKDLKRFNILSKYFPLLRGEFDAKDKSLVKSKDYHLDQVSIRIDTVQGAIGGIPALKLAYMQLNEYLENIGVKPVSIVELDDLVFEYKDSMLTASCVVYFDIHSSNSLGLVDKHFVNDVEYRRNLAGSIPPHYIGISSGSTKSDIRNIRIYDTRGTNVSINTYQIKDTGLRPRFSNIQLTLRTLLGNYYYYQTKNIYETKNVDNMACAMSYLRYYAAGIRLIRAAEAALKSVRVDFNELNLLAVFLSAKTLGTEFKLGAYKAAVARILEDTHRGKQAPVPQYYKPEHIIKNALPRPTFDNKLNAAFVSDGSIITREEYENLVK
ncbi:putative poly(A) polymerase catalytic subunit [Faustovirus]|nr:putative poly(A) polymerase catalytic subunit [Faustovirus]